MTRTLTPGMETAVASSDGTILYFIRIDTSGGSTYLCTAPVDIDWDSQTWQGVGGMLLFGGIEETGDHAGQGVDLTLSGVDPAIIALLLTNDFRGRLAQLWLAHMDDGEIVNAPLDLGTYLQLADYTITEQRGDQPTVNVHTRVQSRLATLRSPMPVRTNIVSHNDMLTRAGLSEGDTFFQNAAAIAGRVIRWGPFQIGADSPAPYRGFNYNDRGKWL